MAQTIIIGAGMTGLAAGISSGFPVYEASDRPGGICRSIRKDGFHFEEGGGHWIFGVDNLVLAFLRSIMPLKRYNRKAHALIDGKLIPYPVQQHIGCVGNDVAADIMSRTMKDWLESAFGYDSCEQFFYGFNDMYTAGLYDKIAPQDTHKNPSSGSGYNDVFYYPVGGLDVLADEMAKMADVRTGKRLVAIDTARKVAVFHGREEVHYDRIISTIPLDRMIRMARQDGVVDEPCPYTSVIVVNIGAEPGHRMPDSHWVYFPKSDFGFHRVGFYSNIDEKFAPEGKVALYVEKAYRAGDAKHEDPDFASNVIRELKIHGYIGNVMTAHTSLVETAYTWRWPGSTWIEDSLDWLAERDIYSIGRYGKWKFQGIAESIRDGLLYGAALRHI